MDQYGVSEPEQRRYYTHSVLGSDELNEAGDTVTWNRTLDYLFASADTDWLQGSTDVLQYKDQLVGEPNEDGQYPFDWTLKNDPFSLSDHAPVFGIWELNP